MSNTDLVLLHAPHVYDFREKTILYGPVSEGGKEAGLQKYLRRHNALGQPLDILAQSTLDPICALRQ